MKKFKPTLCANCGHYKHQHRHDGNIGCCAATAYRTEQIDIPTKFCECIRFVDDDGENFEIDVICEREGVNRGIYEQGMAILFGLADPLDW